MSNTDDWDAVPVKAAKNAGKAAPQSAASNTADWDAVPVAGASPAKHESAGVQQKNRIDVAAHGVIDDVKHGNVAAPGIGVLEGGASLGSGLTGSIVGGFAGGARTLYNLVSGEGFDKSVDLGAQTTNSVQNAMTYQPRTNAGKLVNEVVSAPFNAAKAGFSSAGGDVGQALNGEKGRMVGEAIGDAAPDVAGALLGGRAALKAVAPKAAPAPAPAPAAGPIMPDASRVPAYIRKAQADFESAKAAGAQPSIPTTPTGVTQAQPSVPPKPAPIPAPVADGDLAGAAEAAGASQAVKAAIDDAGDKVHSTAAQRHIEASSLPVPIELTKGQATGDVNLISHERNMRGKYPEMATRFNEANGKLVENIDAIRDAAGPDVNHINHVESGQSLIDAYKAKDAALSEDISAKYKALEEANGGQFPVDGQAFVKAADAALAKKMKGRYVPPEILADMDQIRAGGAMTYENFENMRTNLAAEARKAERAGDGNRAMATALVRDALESIPITGETAAIKPLADAARNAAKARFDLIKSDAAYKAAINDSVSADKFIGKFVVDAPVKNVKTLQANLAHDPIAGQTVATGAINYLKDRAMSGTKFKQDGYNKALKALRPKLNDLVQPEQAAHLESLGNVARYTMEQPEGSYVNNSNTHVSQMAQGAVNTFLDAKTLGATKVIRNVMEKNKMKKEVNESLKPGAGIKISEFPQ